MEDNPLEALLQDLVTPTDSIREIYRRNQELQAKEDNWRTQRNADEASGAALPPQWKDAEYQALMTEREQLMEELKNYHNQSRLDKDVKAALSARLSPEQKSQLRQEIIQRLQSCPLEIKTDTAAVMDKIAQEIRAKYGSTEEVEKALAKAEAVKQQMLKEADEPATSQ